jgi:hypothetical protein
MLKTVLNSYWQAQLQLHNTVSISSWQWMLQQGLVTFVNVSMYISERFKRASTGTYEMA